MTNIEFLVNELRKANETIANLRKENAKVRAEKRNVMAHNAELARRINNMEREKVQKVQLGDIDALAPLKKEIDALAMLKNKMEENS